VVATTFPLLLFLALAALIAITFATVARSTGQVDYHVDYGRANRLRGVLFLSLAVVLAIFLLITLPRLPYPVEAAVPEQIVNVVGKQYAFSLTSGPGPQSLETWERDFSPVADVHAGSLVEFRVRTLDVNHGFSIYTPDGHLLAQTQAMPGYVNRIRVRFDKPGTYPVRCLEFCGMSHHAMKGVIEVAQEARQ
jgi:cytochrome c oxidase subunit 2